MTNENIKFIEAKKESNSSVRAEFRIEGQSVSVEWSNIHEGTGETLDTFGLTNDVNSVDSALAARVIDAINEGEGGEDDELYLAIRDTFDATDAAELAAQ
jgi:hypothetical protein